MKVNCTFAFVSDIVKKNTNNFMQLSQKQTRL